MRNARILATGSALILASAIGAFAAEPTGDAKAGEAAFKKLGCYSCHGVWGQGTWRDGPRINPPMPYEAMLQQLRTPRYEMPPYVESQLSNQTVADIHAYLASRPKADVKSIPLLQR